MTTSILITTNLFASDGKITKILAIGDSLTYGLHHQSDKNLRAEKYSYILNLQDLLGSYQYTENKQIVIDEKGLLGDTASAMNDRLESILKNNQYDYVLVLAGANDLACPDNKIKNIIKYLKRIYKTATDNSSKLLVMTIPNSTGPADPTQNIRKNAINDWIRSRAQRKSYILVDLAQETSLSSHKDFWDDDGFHFSKKGYDNLGGLVFNALSRDITPYVQIFGN